MPSWSNGLASNLISIFTNASWGPELLPLLVIVTAAFDLIWIAFVGALVARHTAYMSVNVTTYEVLVRPAHVVRRFPKNRGRFWFLADFGISQCLRNWVSYWTLSSEHDTGDFLGPPQELNQWGPAEPDHRRGNPDVKVGIMPTKQVY